MRAEAKARLAAIAAIDQFERAQGQGLSEADRRLLHLFRSDEVAKEIGTAWLSIQKHFKHASDDQHVIKGILNAQHFILAMPAARKSRKMKAKNFERARQAVDTLQHFLTQESEHFSGTLVIDKSNTLVSSLSWLREQLEIASHMHPKFTRTSRSDAGRRVMFAAHLVGIMAGLFGRPCYSAVAALTEIAFKTEFTTDQTRDAWRDHGSSLSLLPLQEQSERNVTPLLPKRRR
jgi:hypothetical protein